MIALSAYMGMPDEVVEAQSAVFRKFGVSLEHRCFKLSGGSPARSLAQAIDDMIQEFRDEDVVAIFDVDCIPLSEDAVPQLMYGAMHGALCGAAQQANHFPGSKAYVSHACMSFTTESFRDMGWPSFAPRPGLDVGAFVTAAAEKSGVPVLFMWPTDVEVPKWDLEGGRRFGLGTTYEGKFYHSFQSRHDKTRFLRKCEEVLSREGP